MPTEQEKLIGAHPGNNNFIGSWLESEDMDVPDDNPNKKHRKLSELLEQRQVAIKEIANWIIKHHVDGKRLKRLQLRKAEIMTKYGIPMDKYIDSQNLFPKLDAVKSGNATEIILSQYLQETSGLRLLAYKLTYNPNVDQAMKGDDCLLFNTDNLTSGVIVGEAKFRGTPTKVVVNEMIENLQDNKKLPISLTFISQHFTANGDEDMAGKIDDLLFELSTGKIPVTNVGFLLSSKGNTKSKDAALQVEANLSTSNPNLIIISLGTDNPKEIITEAFKLANEYLLAQI